MEQSKIQHPKPVSMLTYEIQQIGEKRTYGFFDNIKKILNNFLNQKDLERKFYNKITCRDTLREGTRVVNMSWCWGKHFVDDLKPILHALAYIDKVYYEVLRMPEIFKKIRNELSIYIHGLQSDIRESILYYNDIMTIGMSSLRAKLQLEELYDLSHELQSIPDFASRV